MKDTNDRAVDATTVRSHTAGGLHRQLSSGPEYGPHVLTHEVGQARLTTLELVPVSALFKG